MKKLVALLLCLLMVFAVCACSGGNNEETKTTAAPTTEASTGGDKPLAGTYDIKIWCAKEAKDLFESQIAKYNSTNTDGIKFNVTVQEVSESDAGTNMITDVEAGGDLYCFAQDQFARLVEANALAKLGDAAQAIVKEANDAGVVSAATSGTAMYAYPMTSDNGYFMYYDKSIIPESDLDSLEKLIEDCEKADKFFAMETESSAWYLAGFFFGTGCHSSWTTDSDGKFITVDDNFNSDKGLIAAKGIEKLVKSKCALSSSKAEEFANGAAIVVTGTWAYNDVKAILGDNLGATDLPSFTVDGNEYHIGSFNGCKLLGVKPQKDAVRQAALHKLAQYLTDYDCQMERFNTLSWGPANKTAQASEAVKANPGLAALLLQGAYSVPQGQIHDAWWNIAKVIATEIKESTDEAGLKAALEHYSGEIQKLFSLSGYILVGAWNGWNNADTSYTMTPNGDIYSITLTVPQADYMGGRIVTAGSWDNDKGAAGQAQVTTGKDLIKDLSTDDNPDNNIVFVAPGTYNVVWDSAKGEISITAS